MVKRGRSAGPVRAGAPRHGSALEEALLLQLLAEAAHTPPLREYRFAPPRRWRFDLAWPPRWLAVEVEGGTWSAGRHTRAAGYRADVEKYNAAALAGWTVLRVTADMVRDGTGAALVAAALAACPIRALPWLESQQEATDADGTA